MQTELKKTASIIIGILPLFLLGFLFDKYAVNIPHWDDHALKNFIINWQATSSITEKFKELFALHNEHRIVFTRIVTWLIFKLNHGIDYRIMMIVGNASLIGIWFYFIKSTLSYKISWWYISVSGWLLFSFAISENLFWGMASVQNFWVILWSFSSFFFLTFNEQTNSKTNIKFDTLFILAIIASLFAVFTSGNGLIVPIIGAFILLVQNKRKDAMIWGIVFGVVLAIHLLTFTKRPDEVNEITEVSIATILQGVTLVSGAIFDTDWAFPNQRFIVSQTLGGILLIISIVFLLRRLFAKYIPQNNTYVIQKQKTDLFLSACLLFILGTISGIVVSRNGLGTGVYLTSKYKIYSILLLIICVIYTARLLSKKMRNIGKTLMVSLGIILWINSYLNDYQFVLNQFMQRKVDLANMQMEAKRNGIKLSNYPYKAPTSNLFDELDFTKATKDSSLVDDIQLKTDEVVFLENDLEAVKQRVYFILKSDTQRYFFSTQPQRNKSRIGIFKNYFQRGFTVTVPRMGIKTDFYEFYIMIKTDKSQRLFSNKKLVRIDGIDANNTVKNW